MSGIAAAMMRKGRSLRRVSGCERSSAASARARSRTVVGRRTPAMSSHADACSTPLRVTPGETERRRSEKGAECETE